MFALVSIGLAAAVGISPMACSMQSTPPNDAGEDESEVTEVLMQDIAFVPGEVTIRVGQRVRWTNRDAVLHTTTSGNPGDADAGSIWDSGNLSNGESFTFQFDEQGEFVYFCEIHPGIMRDARVIVEP